MSGDFNAFCVVGLGNHARSKIIPAIRSHKKLLSAVVTNSVADDIGAEQSFRTVEAAIAALPRDVTFFVSTPPELHYEQVGRIVDSAFDVFVEKPAFLNPAQVIDIQARSKASGSLVVEAFMHRYTQVFAELERICVSRRDAIECLSIRFLLPEIPASTYRSGQSVAASTLFDVGSYALSLLFDLGFCVSALALEKVENVGKPLSERLHIRGGDDRARFDIVVGKGDRYENVVSVKFTDGEWYEFFPFFYGRAGARTIRQGSRDTQRTQELSESSAFEVMLAKSRSSFSQREDLAWNRMLQTTDALHRLGCSLMQYRYLADEATNR